MMWLRRLAAICLLFFLTIATSGCSHSQGGKQSTKKSAEPLIIWNAFEEPFVASQLIERFTSRFETVKAEVVPKDLLTIEAEFINAVANGEGPDVIILKNEWLPKHRSALTEAPTEIITPSKLRGLQFPVAAERNIIGDQIVGVSPTMEPLSLVTNLELLHAARRRYQEITPEEKQSFEFLEKVPRTWAELRDQSRFITERRGNFIVTAGVALGTVHNLPEPVDTYASMVISNGGTMIREDGLSAAFHLTLADGQRPGLGAIDFLSSFVDPAHPNYSWNTGIGNPLDRMAEGKLAHLIGYPSLEKELKRRNPSLDIGINPVPKTNLLDPQHTLVRLLSFAVPRTAKQPETAWRFLAWLASEGADDYALDTGRISAKKPPESDRPVEGSDLTIYEHVYRGIEPENTAAAIRSMLDAAWQNRRSLPVILESGANQVTTLLASPSNTRKSEALP